MKIKYLGTAAAECIPALFCECEVCKKARETKEKNVRSRSQVLINDDLLIDYPPDSFYHFTLHDIDYSKLRNVIISHSHEDHFYPLDFEYFRIGFSHPKKCLPFTVWGSIDLYEPLEFALTNQANQGLRYQEIFPYKTYNVGKYQVTPLEAEHGTAHPYIYIVSDGEKTMLYCNDTGFLKDEVFQFLENGKFSFDLISLDCTSGTDDVEYNCHMGLPKNRALVKKFKEIGVIDDKTKVIITHFSHNGGHVLYKELSEIVKEDGFIVSFDGLEIEL